MKKIIFLFFIAGFFAFNSCEKSDITDNDVSDTVKDIDGNIYHTVTLGTQVWMVENLKTTKYKNGDPIQNVTDDADWNNLTSGAYCNYDNNKAIGDKYGRLYNWYVISDSRGVAPKGYRLPTMEDWNTLYTFVSANIGTSLNEYKALASNKDWEYSDKIGDIGNNLSINNSSGFTVLPGGWRSINMSEDNPGEFGGIGTIINWWGEYDKNTQKTVSCLFGATNSSWRNEFDWDLLSPDSNNLRLLKTDGKYIRCIKDK